MILIGEKFTIKEISHQHVFLWEREIRKIGSWYGERILENFQNRKSGGEGNISPYQQCYSLASPIKFIAIACGAGHNIALSGILFHQDFQVIFFRLWADIHVVTIILI
jgi:hypothetical protein